MSPPIRVLTIDGGGVRGIIPTRVLAALEAIADRPIATLFDVMVGTSNGGMLVLGLSMPGDDGTPRYRAIEVGEVYRTRGQEIFPRSGAGFPRSLQEARAWWSRPSPATAMLGINPEVGNARYSPAGIQAIFTDLYGDTMLSEALTDVAVTAFDLQSKTPVVFRSLDARATPGHDIAMRDAARATSAAPTFFPPHAIEWDGVDDRLFIDGGVFAKNPALIGYVEGVAAAKERGRDPADLIVVSLGTGTPERSKSLSYEEFIGRSWLKLAEDVFAAAEDGQALLHDRMLGALLGDRYWRFQTTLTSEVGYRMDAVEPENAARLVEVGDALVADRMADLTRLAAVLEDGAGAALPAPGQSSSAAVSRSSDAELTQ
jgi:uncharacterized protein